MIQEITIHNESVLVILGRVLKSPQVPLITVPEYSFRHFRHSFRTTPASAESGQWFIISRASLKFIKENKLLKVLKNCICWIRKKSTMIPFKLKIMNMVKVFLSKLKKGTTWSFNPFLEKKKPWIRNFHAKPYGNPWKWVILIKRNSDQQSIFFKKIVF
jgi:hypothetical protein